VKNRNRRELKKRISENGSQKAAAISKWRDLFVTYGRHRKYNGVIKKKNIGIGVTGVWRRRNGVSNGVSMKTQ
jgi:hypothetical protein